MSEEMERVVPELQSFGGSLQESLTRWRGDRWGGDRKLLKDGGNFFGCGKKARVKRLMRTSYQIGN